MAIIGLDHVQLAMPPGSENCARAFYIDVLGMTELAKPEPLAARGGCWFASGTTQVHLGVEDPFAPAKKAHPALLVDDLAALKTMLDRNDVPFADGVPLDGYVRGDIHDPFGNRIEIMERIS